MGTRGYIIYLIRNKIFYQYNHWDSYPSGLGADLTQCIIDLLKKYTYEELIEMLYNLNDVCADSTPTPEEIEKLEQYSDATVSSQKLTEWYVLLRKCQGRLDLTLESGYILSNKFDKMEDCKCDLFIEYVYLLDFNNDTFYCNRHCVGKISDMPKNWYDYPEKRLPCP